MDLKNSPSTGGPSKLILVTGAICLSIILASLAYKLTLSQKASAIKNNNIVGLGGTTTDPADLVNNAIYDSQTASLAENASNTSPFAIKSDDSVSDRVSKKLFSGYLYAQQTDGVTDDSAGQVSDAVLSQITQKDLPEATFSASQAKIFSPTSKDQIKQYGNDVASVIKAYYQQIANDPKYEKDLPSLAKIFKLIGYSIMDQKVPVSLVREHTSLANSYVLTGQGMEMVGDQSKDPVRALLGVKTLKEISQSQTEVLISIGAYFNKNDIIFGNDEAGALWNQYLNTSTNATSN
ncbi:MAG: hypothetical protein WCO16_01435 [bacterium]